MSILNYLNRNKYKNKAAIELEFRKTSSYKLPPGYHNMDICLVGGGAGGLCWPEAEFGTNLYGSGDPVGSGLARGGPGGFVINLYGKDLPTSNIYVKVGNGGYCGKDAAYIDYDVERYKGEYTFRYKSAHFIGAGESSYIKNLDNNTILYEALGGGAWYSLSEYRNKWGNIIINNKKITPGGGANLGGGCEITILESYISYGKTRIRERSYRAPINGATKGNPYFNYKYVTNLYNTKLIRACGDAWSSYPEHEKWYIEYIWPSGNKIINLEGYGEPRIFDDGKYIAGGGCVGAGFYIGDDDGPIRYDALNHPVRMNIGDTSLGLQNEDGGGESGIVRRNNNLSNGTFNFSLIRCPGNGKPNTGGGGAGGIYYVGKTWTTSRADLGPFTLAGPGRGGSGLVIIRCYPDEKRPKVNFVEGVNKYIIQ